MNLNSFLESPRGNDLLNEGTDAECMADAYTMGHQIHLDEDSTVSQGLVG